MRERGRVYVDVDECMCQCVCVGGDSGRGGVYMFARAFGDPACVYVLFHISGRPTAQVIF